METEVRVFFGNVDQTVGDPGRGIAASKNSPDNMAIGAAQRPDGVRISDVNGRIGNGRRLDSRAHVLAPNLFAGSFVESKNRLAAGDIDGAARDGRRVVTTLKSSGVNRQRCAPVP